MAGQGLSRAARYNFDSQGHGQMAVWLARGRSGQPGVTLTPSRMARWQYGQVAAWLARGRSGTARCNFDPQPHGQVAVWLARG